MPVVCSCMFVTDCLTNMTVCAAARCRFCGAHVPIADIGKQVVLSGEGRNFCGGIDLSVARSILKTVNDAQCPSRAREKLRRDILAMQVCSCDSDIGSIAPAGAL